MRALDLVKQSGVSYRRLDYWVRSGYVTCHHPNGQGSGYQRQFTDTEAVVVTLMGVLTRAGITPAYAETLARDLRARGWAELGGGLAITVTEQSPTTRARAGADGLCAGCTQARREKTT